MVFYIISCAVIGYIGTAIACEVLEISEKFPSAKNVCIFTGALIGGVYGLSYDYEYLMAEELVDCIEN
jgi:hypothetical protein